MPETAPFRATVTEGARVEGIIAQTVVIENLNFRGVPLPEKPTERPEEEGIGPCPYPGLAFFGPNDSKLFFGRETAIEHLRIAVVQRPFTALVGSSGSGKSSLALAGLAPRLHAESVWRFSHFRVGNEPDRNPFMAIGRAIVPLLGEKTITERLTELQRLAGGLECGSISLSNLLGQCRAQNFGKRILLIADQFEETFTLVTDEERRNRFLTVLLEGFRFVGGSPDISLIITIRGDFYGTALRYRALADALQGNVENLGPMTRDELREAIVRPAGIVQFESGLVDTLLDDVHSQPGGLPLLQFALREMWSRQQHRCIKWADYDAIGGVKGAVARRAQTIFADVTRSGTDDGQVRLFRQLFTRLVTLGEGAEDTRRVVDRQELGPSAWLLAQRLAGENNRLIVTSAPTPNHETAEVIHEALIRNWPTLSDWLARDRAFLSWLRQLKPRVEDWLKGAGDDSALLRGSQLVIAEDWFSRRGDELNEEETNFIKASTLLRTKIAQEEKEARQLELNRQAELAEAARKLGEEQSKRAEAADRARRRTRIALFVSIALLVCAFCSVVVIEYQRLQADELRAAADTERQLTIFTASVMQQISGTASVEASSLSQEANKAVASSSLEDQIQTYLEFARYFDGAWDEGRASDALSQATALIGHLPDNGAVAEQKKRLLGYSHEVAGDVAWGDNTHPGSEFKTSEDEYRTALSILEKANAPTNDLARLHRKIAKALLFEKEPAAAAIELDTADQTLGVGKDTGYERGMIDEIRARVLVAQNDTPSAITVLTAAIDVLQSEVKSKPEVNEFKVALAGQLQELADLQRQTGSSAQAFDSYAASGKLFDQVMAFDPTSFAGATGLDLDRLGMRLLGKTDEADTISGQEVSSRTNAFNAAFGSGIGRFRFGMSIQEVNHLLNPPYNDASLSDLPTAWEWRTTDVRYFFRSISELTDFESFAGSDACLLKEGYVVFMFHEGKLFRIVVRFINCTTQETVIDHFAARYGLPVSGGPSKRRIRYETSAVTLNADMALGSVSLDFVER